ncbi:diguanylate cyclase [Solidesulfovibrio fructosivorans JJ]]|uniref:diguanylate cyclase n=1 Tax=Solidesulfovibrio fructosivorans JJ] TaxID=596151 RepID=E1JTL4_SOLFR|nr:diguanylate cyclase [Solidesulfovibrio fructosivorans]EFL52474.1 diguanylate cyclase [Solidesulfovibrio fructosivorans JJ]]
MMKPSKKKYRPLSKLHLLVVEDEALAREQMGLLLSRFAAKLTTAGDGVDGLEAFRRERPDIVVTDISMPRMDGLDMAANIKKEAPDVPVVLVTAHSDTEFFLRSIDIGIDGYVVKPVDADKLLARLVRLAAGQLETRAASARARLFQFTLDINPNFILTLDGGEVDYVNRTFLDFLGAADLPALKEGRHAGRVLELDGRRHEAADFDWAGRIDARPDVTHQAVFSLLPAEPGQERTFLVSSAAFPELDRRILTFTDITPLAEERRQLITRATTDALTGIANRAGIDEALARERNRAARNAKPLCVIMFDIDHFKDVNDSLGHQAGDAVLAALTGLVSGLVRGHDILGRYGGEEFLVVAPETDMEQGRLLAERLRAAVEAHAFPAAGKVTCSFGLAMLDADESAHALVARADAALYRAKETGRNRVAG